MNNISQGKQGNGQFIFQKKEHFKSANGLLHIDPYISNVGCFSNIPLSSCMDDAQLGGMHNVAMCIIKSSLILNPLSAMTSS